MLLPPLEILSPVFVICLSHENSVNIVQLTRIFFEYLHHPPEPLEIQFLTYVHVKDEFSLIAFSMETPFKYQR